MIKYTPTQYIGAQGQLQKGVALDKNHKHFFLIDDGTEVYSSGPSVLAGFLQLVFDSQSLILF